MTSRIRGDHASTKPHMHRGRYFCFVPRVSGKFYKVLHRNILQLIIFYHIHFINFIYIIILKLNWYCASLYFMGLFLLVLGSWFSVNTFHCWDILTCNITCTLGGAGRGYSSVVPDATPGFCGSSYCYCISFVCYVLFSYIQFLYLFYSVRYWHCVCKLCMSNFL